MGCDFLSKEIRVSVFCVTKKYEVNKKKKDRIDVFSSSKNDKSNEFWALCGISFEVFAGEAIGLIGTNGSGKSTLSNLIAGMSAPTTGRMLISGKTSIIAIGLGLRKELTGRENIRLKCLLLGMTNKEIDKIMDDIIIFADLDDFIDQPLRNYSSGMKSRLGFAISVHQNPDILIIDEALSVGDETFYQRCIDKIKEFKSEGKTIFFVSHSNKQVRNICDKAMWIHEGNMKEFGPVNEVVDSYNTYVKAYKNLSKKEQRKHKAQHKKKRRDFILDDYYKEMIGQNLDMDQNELQSVFYPSTDSANMGLNSIMIVFVIVGFLVGLGIFYMS